MGRGRITGPRISLSVTRSTRARMAGGKSGSFLPWPERSEGFIPMAIAPGGDPGPVPLPPGPVAGPEFVAALPGSRRAREFDPAGPCSTLIMAFDPAPTAATRAEGLAPSLVDPWAKFVPVCTAGWLLGAFGACSASGAGV